MTKTISLVAVVVALTGSSAFAQGGGGRQGGAATNETLSQTFRDISAVFEDAGDACRCAYERGKKLINEGPPNLKI